MFETKNYRVELIYVENLGECRRVIFHGNYGNPWFAGIDIARCIGYSNARNVVSELIKTFEKGHVVHLFPLETIKSMKVPEINKPRAIICRTTLIDVYGMNMLLLKTTKTDFFKKNLASIGDKFKTNPSLYSVDYIL